VDEMGLEAFAINSVHPLGSITGTTGKFS